MEFSEYCIIVMGITLIMPTIISCFYGIITRKKHSFTQAMELMVAFFLVGLILIAIGIK